VVFGGFSAQSLRDRIEDAGAVMIITADEQARGGKSLPLKSIVDEAIAMGGCETIQNVHRLQAHRRQHRLDPARDRWLHEEMAGQGTSTCEPEWVSAEHPLFLLYTSGSTGKPKGVQHSTGGYLLHAALTTKPGPSTSSPTTCSGARPTSAGSPATPTSPTARWPWAAPRSSSKACPPTRMPAASGR
jgi:acetyl-CoA synthetase